MRRTLALLAALLLALGLAGCGDDDDDATTAAEDSTTTSAAEAEETTTTAAPDAEPAAGDATVAVAATDLGDVLVDAEGMTLYLFTPDSMDASACTGDCLTAWPPLTQADGEPVAGDGIDQALLAVAGDDQVAYNGHRLYTYGGDTAPGDTTGQGVGDKWYAVTPAGEAVS